MFEDCRMPDLSKRIEKVTPSFLASRFAGLNKKFSKKEFDHAISQIVRLSDKALYEYQIAREGVIRQIESSDEITFISVVNHLENCINSLSRVHKFFKIFNDREFSKTVPKEIKTLAKKKNESIIDFRNTIEHMDEKVSEISRDGKSGTMMFVNEDASKIQIRGYNKEEKELVWYEISTEELASVIEITNKITRLYSEHGVLSHK